jgi:hypothetical protein
VSSGPATRRPITTLGEQGMTGSDAESEFKLARSYIAEAIKNAHSAIRTSWTIMFTAGTFGAVSTLSAVLRCKRNLYIPPITDYPIPKSSCHFNDRLINYILCFVVYFLTFARFYLGDCRMFDIKYSELFQLVLNEISLKSGKGAEDRFQDIMRYNDRKFFKFEFLWLMFQALIVILLAFQIDNAEFFVEVYIVLLLGNCAWLYFSIVRSKAIITETVSAVLPHMHREMSDRSRISPKLRLPLAAGLVWIWNNLGHAVILLIVVVFTPYLGKSIELVGMQLSVWPNSMTIAVFVCLSNCLLDFKLSHNFYFPKFLDDYLSMRRHLEVRNPGTE